MFDPNGPRILIVEDDRALSDLLTIRLELAGYRTAAVSDGLRALATVNAVQPEAIVLDINMPGMDGFGVLAALAKRPPGKRPPVLVLTARNAPDDVRRCIQLGAKDYLAKPFETAKLLKRVDRLLRRPIVEIPATAEKIQFV